MIDITVCRAGQDLIGIHDDDLAEYSVTIPYRGAATGTFTIPADHDAITQGYMDLEDVYLQVYHRERHRFTAWIVEPEGDFGIADPEPGTVDVLEAERTFAFRSLECTLDDTYAVIAPENPISARPVPAGRGDLAQAVATGTTTPGTAINQSGYYAWTGTDVETAVLDIISRNLTRIGTPHRLAPNQHRGPEPARPDVRMLRLSEATLPDLDAAGLGVRVYVEPGDDRPTIAITEPGEYGDELTTEGPILPGGSWRKIAPTATRVIVGGPGEAAARAFVEVIDTALEARFGRKVEVFLDATGGNFPWPTTYSEDAKAYKYYESSPDVAQADRDRFGNSLRSAGRRKLAEHAPDASLSVQLAEDGDFTYGGEAGFEVGDRVRLRETPTSEPVFEDRISKVTIDRARNADEVVVPIIGEAETNENGRLRRTITAIAARQRRQATDR